MNDAHHGRSWPLLIAVVAVITLGVARKAEDGFELAPDVFLLKPCFWKVSPQALLGKRAACPAVVGGYGGSETGD